MILSGGPVDYLAAFLGGVLLSFTPCVYPLIPISVSYIGLNAAHSRLKGFLLSVAYVTGIAVTYSILGLIASLTGQLFGRISSHPVTYIVAGLVIVFFGISMFDVFNISLTNLIRLPKYKKQDYLSTFVLGLISGLVIGPCVTPALGAILTYLATKKNIVYGMLLLFSFAYGMGLVLILAGTFTGLLAGLPKSGRWMVYAKRVGAAIVLAVGVYFIYTGIRRL
ncbi:MAG: cytochrome c biogenesis protein CcdA [Candidatus Omnitrophota bacterium]